MGLEVIMRESFALSYGLLCAVLVLQSLLLHAALRRAARLSRLYAKEEERQKQQALRLPWQIPAGTRLPEFAAPLLGTDRILTQADLKGRETILLFVSPADAASTAHHKNYHHIGPAFGSMLDTVEGEVYIVCKGSRQDCQRFVNGRRAIWDVEGHLSRSFSITVTPRAVHLDEETIVTRYGEPEEPITAPHSTAGMPEDRALAQAASYGGPTDIPRGFYRKGDAEIAQEAHKGVGHG